jgi:hypothetical protein
MVPKLSEIWPGLFIPDPDPDPDILPIPDPGSRVKKGTGSRIPDPQHCSHLPFLSFPIIIFVFLSRDNHCSL